MMESPPRHEESIEIRLNSPAEEQADDAAAQSAPPPAVILRTVLESVQYVLSCTLLAVCVSLVIAATRWYSLVFFVLLLVALAVMEGGQGCLVGLQSVQVDDTHVRTAQTTQLLEHRMEAFIVGRQFLVVLVVFVLNQLTTTREETTDDSSLWHQVTSTLQSTGLPVILTVTCLGQLTPQVVAAPCMLDFCNTISVEVAAYASLAMEATGLLHAAYLVKWVFQKQQQRDEYDDNDSTASSRPSSPSQAALFWGRVLVSVGLLLAACSLTVVALVQGHTTSTWPAAISIPLFLGLLCVVGLLEGLQIALFAVDLTRLGASVAQENCRRLFKGQNLQAFLIGRQILVTGCMFVVAKITSMGPDSNLWGLPTVLQRFLHTGLLGALMTTLLGSLAWRVLASSFPMAFLSNPAISVLITLCLWLEKSGLCSASWVLARYIKQGLGFQADEVYLEDKEEEESPRDRDIDRLVTIVKFTYSLALLAFATVLVMGAIFTRQTMATSEFGVPTYAAFIIFWFLIVCLAMMEGGQGALVGLQPIVRSRYQESHAKTAKITSIAHKGDNMERFIVGRQFLVVLVVFVTNMVSSATEDASVFGLPSGVTEIFLGTGLGVILVTITIGQLAAQVNAADCMLDFLNNYGLLAITYVSLAIEASGLLHCVYLVQIIFAKLTGTAIDSDEPPRSGLRMAWFWLRVVASLGILAFSFAVTLSALFSGQTTMWPGVPEAVSVVIFFVLMCFVGLMEGMQIALFTVVNYPEEELKKNPTAYNNCQLTFRDQNLQAFLIGRQICVTVCTFVVARITTLDVDPITDPTIFGVRRSVQEFFNTGLLGAVITTVVASLAWRVVASTFPVAFLSNPLINIIIRLCLVLEGSGICSAAWILGRFTKLTTDMQLDAVHLDGAPRQTKEPVTRRDQDIDVTITVLKHLFSLSLLGFSITIVTVAIFLEKTRFGDLFSPVVTFVMFVLLICWLALMEGGQGCLVGLQPIDRQLYRTTHSLSRKNTAVAHKGDNMERYIVGRQFLVVLVVFAINLAGSTDNGTTVLGLPTSVTDAVLGSGLGVILITIMLGQLTSQVSAASCMLDFINNHFMLLTTYISLGIEMSGVLHAVYLVQYFFSAVTGIGIDSDEPPRSPTASLFFWFRVFASSALLVFAFVVTVSALFLGKTTMWGGVPPAVSIVLLIFLMCFVGMMEGLQIAVFAVLNIPGAEMENHKRAAQTCQLILEGKNLQSFLIGRQMCVTISMFLVAHITSCEVESDEDTILGVSRSVQLVFNTGILGAIITTIVASLAWRIMASSFPIAFLSNPLIIYCIHLCLFLEALGVCSAAWFLSLVQKRVVGYQEDSLYIGRPNQVEAPADDEEEGQSGIPNYGSTQMSTIA